jgi:ABC-type nitrate/sulfonate/bicarbonate transport system, permease component
MKEILNYFLVMISLPIIWLIAVKCSSLPSSVLPPPDMVASLIWEERANLLTHTLATLKIALIGYAISNVITLALSISFLYFRPLEDFITPWAVVIKNVPYVTVASVLIVTMGDTIAPKLIIVVLVTFFPLLANLKKGLRAVDPVLLDRMQTLHASRWQVFRKVRWPAALPYYMAGHEIAFTASIIGAIIAEWFFSSQGLGYLIVQSITEYRADRLYAVTFIASTLSVLVYIGIRAADRHFFKWKSDAQKD